MRLRAEISRGDLRPLYLGWLLCAQSGDLDDDDVEPPVPAVLAELSASLKSFTEFLRVDPDLIQVAASESPPLASMDSSDQDVRAWIAKLPGGEKDAFLARLIAGEVALAGELFQRMRRELAGRDGQPLDN